MVYIATLIMLFAFSKTKGKLNDKLFLFCTAFVLIVTCFRSPEIGIDTAGGYYKYFLAVQKGTHLTWVEPAWEPLNVIALHLGLGYQGVIAFAGLLYILPFAYVISETSDNKCYSLALYYAMYFVLISYNMMRQMVAVSFSLLVVHFFQEKKMVKAFLSLVIGFCFHKSIIVVLPLLVFIRLRFGFFSTVMMVALSFIIGVGTPKRVFLLLTGQYSRNLLSTDGYAGFRSNILIPAFLALLFSVFFLFVIYFEFEDIKYNVWYLMSLFGLIVMNLTIQMGQGTRIVYYYSQAQVFFFPKYFDAIQQQVNKRFLKAFYYCYLLFNFFRILLSQWDTLTPYRFFWQV